MSSRGDRVKWQGRENQNKLSKDVEETAINNGLVSPPILIGNYRTTDGCS